MRARSCLHKTLPFLADIILVKKFQIRAHRRMWLLGCAFLRRVEMLTEFDQNTIANITAALEYVCKKIPANKDSQELRKFLGTAMIACANGGKRNYIDLQNAGLTVLREHLKSQKSSWVGRIFTAWSGLLR
jgi:hypothetical protein